MQSVNCASSSMLFEQWMPSAEAGLNESGPLPQTVLDKRKDRGCPAGTLPRGSRARSRTSYVDSSAEALRCPRALCRRKVCPEIERGGRDAKHASVADGTSLTASIGDGLLRLDRESDRHCSSCRSGVIRWRHNRRTHRRNRRTCGSTCSG